MFGRNKNDTSAASKDIGLLGIDTHFEGSIRFTGTLRIDGVVKGDIISEPGSGSILIINQQATVTGNIVSDSVLISGKVEGNLRAPQRVEIFRSGYVKGDIYTGGIMIEGGAEFDGYCHMMDGERDARALPKVARRAPGSREDTAAPSEESPPKGST
ncbi:MAG: polymer-forming cytoskeletal protein [SAR324 cluster bacterium]|nr:polymer-forming cytoskeletal protein [SAR324 cluster bacterium]